MKLATTMLLSLAAAALAAHVIVAAWFPGVIAERYPASIARIYSGKAGVAPREEVARLEPVEGRPGVSRVVLIPSAVEKLGIKTETIAERPIERTRRIGSHLVAQPALPASIASRLTPGTLAAAVPLAGTADTPAADLAAEIIPLVHAGSPTAPAAERSTLKARFLGIATASDKSADRTAYYEVPAGHAYEPGDFVIAKVALARNGAPGRVVSAEAILIEPNGRPWIYVRTAPNQFIREPVDIERSDDTVAVLKLGPPPGTEVVTAGTFELYGAESSIGLERVGQ